LRGVAFAVAPLAAALLALMGLAVARGGEPQTVWLVALVGEVFRWAVYGIFLGLIHPIFRARPGRESVIKSSSRAGSVDAPTRAG
jgi:hypothetical protein